MEWDNLRSFVTIAESGTLTKAAKKLGCTAATLSRRIDVLEAQMGYKLLRRNTDGTTLTADGRRVLDYAQKAAEQIRHIEKLSESIIGEASRPVRISSTEPIISQVLAPALPRLYEQIHDIRVTLSVSNLRANLYQGEADLAVRLARPEGDNLVVRRLPDIELACFASTSYCQTKLNKQDIQDNAWLVYDDSYGGIPEVLWTQNNNLNDSVIMRSSSTTALLSAACSGLGIATLPRFLANVHQLTEVTAPVMPNRETWLVFHADTRELPTLMAIRDWVAESCSKAFAP